MTYSQASRLCSLTTALGDDALMLRAMSGEESVSTPFRFVVEAVSENPHVDPDALVGKPGSVRVELADGKPRHWHGIVTRIAQTGRDERLTRYRIELRPWLWLLGQRADCRIFQNQTVQQIVTKVFERAGFHDFEFALSGGYADRVYCVQYRETDLAFVSRLCEEEGIFWFFRHEERRHVLVLTDTPMRAPLCPIGEVAWRLSDGGRADADLVRAFGYDREVHPGRCALKDFNFEDPGNALAVDARTAAPLGGNDGLEVYDYHPVDYGAIADGARLARLRVEEHRSQAVRLRGSGDCRAMTAGHRFALCEHPDRALDGRYLLVSVHHRLRQPSPFETGEAEATAYDNEFVCVREDAPFRPARVTPRPRITGPQTAIVTGPQGEEIWIDDYGRIKVQFHWDREGKHDEHSSCWIRVAQVWAGKRWGALAHPRIGDEVVVEFLEGDPDQPIVTGSVYNARTMPPYDLPDDKTRTGIRTRSTKGGEAAHYNEIRFDDEKGQEEVYIHAERDKRVYVEHDREEFVGHDERISIANDRTERVYHDESIRIDNNRTERVGVDESITIGRHRDENVGGDQTETIGADNTVQVTGKHVEHVGASASITIGSVKTETVGAASIENVGAAKVLNVGAAYSINVGGGIAENVVGDKRVAVDELYESFGKTVKFIADKELVLECGGAKITLDKAGTVRIEGTKVEIAGSALVDVKGAVIKLNS